MMEIRFANERLKKACEASGERKKRWDEPAAGNLKTRLDDLDAAHSMEDMRNLPGHWKELTGDRKASSRAGSQAACASSFAPPASHHPPAVAGQTR